MTENESPQISLCLANEMADLLTANATFRAGLTGGYGRAIRERVWRVNTSYLIKKIHGICGPADDEPTLISRIEKMRSLGGKLTLAGERTAGKRSAIAAMVYLYLYGKSRDDQGVRKVHQDCLDHLSGQPEMVPHGAAGSFATALAALNDWAAIAPVLSSHPMLGPVRDLQLALTLNAPDQREIACCGALMADAMKAVDGKELAAQAAAARSAIQAFARDHHVEGLRRQMLSDISTVMPAGAQDICDRLLAGDSIGRSEIGVITGRSSRQQSRLIDGLLGTGWVTSDSPKGALRLRIPDALPTRGI